MVRRLFFMAVVLLLLPAGTASYYFLREELLPEFPETEKLYEEMQLADIINPFAFQQAITGYYKIGDKQKELLTVIDYSKPSSEERLYIIDMSRKKLLHTSLVSHGRNSGNLYATSFSNKNGSYKSSLGFFMTEKTYIGKNGYSLVLEGLEKEINDNAKQRAIVIHGASYANPSVIASTGRLGRSLGCPALPQKNYKEIINLIKEGSLVYIYAADSDYPAKSSILAKG